MKMIYKGILGLAMASASTWVIADSKQHRLIWDASPSSQATIGFTPTGSNNHHIKYGFTTDEQGWSTKNITAEHTFSGSLTSQFIKLNNLPANSPVYYRICDDAGCGTRLWFKTAPTDNSSFIAIAGGDTRTGWTTRREGNKLVAKIRPLFIMHGGDYTNANSASEMSRYLDDWQLTFSDDLINSINYKRIYPFIATHGNHEDGNYKTLCEVFGIDYDNNNTCNAHDSYGAFDISPLLRVYTLNSQFKNSGWSSYATAMNNWLKQDLINQGNSVKWRFAQYHKPMYPHYSGKSDNTELFSWWAQNFYDYGMNLVVESDTHINKMTQALKPSGSNYNTTTTGGTVFVGEGSWGAPARSANNPKSWTIDLASIQQFKVIEVSNDTINVKTAQFNASADALTYEQRKNNPVILPNNINWWVASTIGETLSLKQSSTGKSIIDFGDGPIDPPGNNVLENAVPLKNLKANKDQELVFTLQVPQGVSSLTFEINGGSGDADLYVKHAQKPSSNSYDCRPFKDGNSESCNINTIQVGTYYIVLKAYKTFEGLTLTGTFTLNGGDTSGGDTINNISVNKDDWYFTSFDLPVGVSKLDVGISGGTGDADLYLQKTYKPTSNSYVCRPFKEGNIESCTVTHPTATTWHIGIKAYENFSGLNLTYQYE
ncbi:pre-peptidase C-terminal domain-containing protein [Pseudoalteromonas denitrificans]|uniref:Pre-peptidase C-terminal domain-containing protein n=1 Tax=Pseudoalteromonas denitrificans DSM 6059 TaxID=1123010 RepID=A0A1I1N414_9GAMM|nr:pre-peptidase C-terminal domain-containing protein [Pseudoalteromonas denitrificans]SFC92086.1 pre-peptidase C-terminal domain-containing protein [Pseudoalteromonas denitrificans DSM 6059]